MVVIKMVKDKQITQDDKKFYDDVIKALNILGKYKSTSNLSAADTDLILRMTGNIISSIETLATVILMEFNKYNGDNKNTKVNEDKEYEIYKQLGAIRDKFSQIRSILLNIDEEYLIKNYRFLGITEEKLKKINTDVFYLESLFNDMVAQWVVDNTNLFTDG